MASATRGKDILTIMAGQCSHLNTIAVARATRVEGCEECLELGDTWVHLRQCLQCGHVGCCDASRNRHATAHFRATGHPLVTSLERGEDWIWCYVDEVFATRAVDA
jgi:uncharacterized UBP type Zn finger protein